MLCVCAGDIVGVRKVFQDVESRADLRKRFIVLPDDPLKLIVDLMLVIMVLITVVEVPVVIGFNLADSMVSTVLDSMIDCSFALDMLLNFRAPFIDSERTVYTVPTTMAAVYLRGSFKLDFISTFPFDKVVTATVGLGSPLGSLKLLRCV